MEIREGYKNTEVGVIPEDWEVKEFGEICYTSKSRMNPITSDSNYKCIELEHLSQGSGFLLGFANSKDLKSQKSFFKEGDVLFGKLRPYLRKFYFADFNGVCTTEIWVLKTEKETSNRFLFHLVQSNKIVDAANLSTGTKMPRAEWKTVSETKISVPSKAEQTAIATVLSDADTLINSLEKLIAKKRNIKQGAMQQLLQPKEGWEVKKLGDFIRFQTGFPFPSENFTNNPQGQRLVKNRDLRSDDSIVYYSGEFSKDFIVKNGDLLIGMDGDFEPVLWQKGIALLNQRVGRVLKFKEISITFLSYTLLKELKEIELRTSGTTVKHLSHSDIEKIEMPLPNFKEQTRIATILSDMDAEIQALETKLEKYRKIKLGMMQNLLTGKIRLI